MYANFRKLLVMANYITNIITQLQYFLQLVGNTSLDLKA